MLQGLNLEIPGSRLGNFVTLSYVDLSSDAQLIKVTRVHEGPVALLACGLGEHTQPTTVASHG
jgi:hypothetical protein